MMAIELNAMLLGCPTDIAGFEKDMSIQIANANTSHAADAQDMEDLIADALKRRCCSSGNRGAAVHMHLRLKKGANQNAAAQPMSRHELADLAEMVASNSAVNSIIKRLANFYVRIAKLRAHIEATHSLDTCAVNDANDAMHIIANATHLRAAHEKNEESMREKYRENQRELIRIMSTLFLGCDIHPDLTEDDLPALETQAHHIAERGCAAQELRRLKIMEAALELQRCNALISLLAATK